jgi:phosphomannomutase/phosphoglucomutase
VGFLKRLFGTDGVRGVIASELTPLFIAKLAWAIGSYFKEGSRILVGYDYRAGGDAIKNILMGVLVLSGVKVYDAGYTPTPALQYAVKTEGFDGGVMITASHNPPEYNGIKVIGPHGVEVGRDEERVIEEIFWSEKFRVIDWRSAVWSVEKYIGVNDLYVKAILEHVDKDIIVKKGFKVLVDPVNNVGVFTTPRLLRELGVKPVVINGDLNYEPTRPPEPTPETLSNTAQVVKACNCDFGVALDGDADRSIFIDEQGRVYWGDRSAVLLAKHLKLYKNLTGKVYTGVSSSVLVEDILRSLGVEVIWLKVGSVDIAHAMMRAGDALCGFEENGGFMYPPHQFVRDGAMTLALFLEMLATSGRRVSELFSELPEYYIVKKKYPMSRDVAVRIIDLVKEEFKSERLITVDGVKVISRDYWVLVRPSGTEPLLRVMLEAKSEEIAKSILERVESIIKEVIKS